VEFNVGGRSKATEQEVGGIELLLRQYLQSRHESVDVQIVRDASPVLEPADRQARIRRYRQIETGDNNHKP